MFDKERNATLFGKEEVTNEPNRRNLSVEETSCLLYKHSLVKKSTKEYARPFIEQAREYIELAGGYRRKK